MKVFELLIEVEKHVVQKNRQQIRFSKSKRRRFIAKSDQAQRAANELTQRLLIYKLQNRLETIDFDVTAEFIFYYPQSKFFTKKGVRSKNLADVSNLIELPQDCLQKSKILADDNLICKVEAKRGISENESHIIYVKLCKVPEITPIPSLV
jgi:Holliday junction resolvase RusA-like endonuclease